MRLRGARRLLGSSVKNFAIVSGGEPAQQEVDPYQKTKIGPVEDSHHPQKIRADPEGPAGFSGIPFKATLEIDPQLVPRETNASNIFGWDSVGHLSLACNLEQAFGITLDVDGLMEMENVHAIVRIITTNLSQKV